MNQINIYAFFFFSSFYLYIFSLILLSRKSFAADSHYEACKPKSCGKGPNITFPFYIRRGLQEHLCGHPRFELDCNEEGYPTINSIGNTYIVESISYPNNSFRVYNSAFSRNSRLRCLPHMENMTLPIGLFGFVNVRSLFLLSKCFKPLPPNLVNYKVGCEREERDDDWGLAIWEKDENLWSGLELCRKKVVAPVDNETREDGRDYVEMLRRGFRMNWTASITSNCSVCEKSGGHCGFIGYQFRCFCPDRPHHRSCKPAKSKVMLIVLLTVIPGIIILCGIGFLVWCRRRRIKNAYFISRNISSGPSSRSDLEGGSLYFGIPVFSYTELEEATNNFDASKELGDGGFGTVYHGKLRDGRDVAIKRLYEHNYKRVEQFMNEIKILTRLRHPNLVSLYGCTSRRSRELLLVYEYVANGTVADHIHGDKAEEVPLSWPVRMNIAIETACALAYLHKSDIIHRDVKTNNILLDDNFCVKVADFGLSRLFPNDVTHISTAPQGTPGYVDPEYHQCYQLTSKSDVYSFGVVLVELISSMPAVDIRRHRHEINLANLAISKIQQCAFDELIDPSLGYGFDADVTRMTTSVAELAFRCLQLEKDMRPDIDEVLAFLKEVRGDTDSEFENRAATKDNQSVPNGVKIPNSPETDDMILLKSKYLQSSPNAVTDMWMISSSTTASSLG